MARNVLLKLLRATRAALNSAGAAHGLTQGEPYLITDEGRLAVGTGTDTYAALALQSELRAIWVGTSAPSDTTAYPLWWDAESGILFLWFADGTSNQWVEAGRVGVTLDPALFGALAGTNTWTGAQTFDGGLVVTAAVQETPVVANTSTAYTVDLAGGTLFDLTMTGTPVVFTFPTATAGRQFTLLLKQDGTGTRLATWPAEVRWAGGTAPTLTSTAAKTDVISFLADGTYWLGFVGGQNFTRA
jgi:hypothetical protein